jgi:hypothetical protein
MKSPSPLDKGGLSGGFGKRKPTHAGAPHHLSQGDFWGFSSRVAARSMRMFVLVPIVVLGCFGKVQAGYEDEYDDVDDFKGDF